MSSVGMSGILSITQATGRIPSVKDPAKIKEAAEQFEALLIGQLLHSAKDKDSGWLGSGGDPSSECATDYAEQQLATTMAQQGGLGLGRMIIAGLQRESG